MTSINNARRTSVMLQNCVKKEFKKSQANDFKKMETPINQQAAHVEVARNERRREEN